MEVASSALVEAEAKSGNASSSIFRLAYADDLEGAPGSAAGSKFVLGVTPL